MRQFFVLFTLLIGSIASATDCASLKDSGDGVPAKYYMQECWGNRALEARNGKLAEEHFRKALAIQLFEAPNYILKVELAESLCLQGRIQDAQRELQEFQCMSRIDLGQTQCPVKQVTGVISKACAALCEGTGSGLSATGRSALVARAQRAARVLEKCGAPNQSLHRTAVPPIEH